MDCGGRRTWRLYKIDVLITNMFFLNSCQHRLASMGLTLRFHFMETMAAGGLGICQEGCKQLLALTSHAMARYKDVTSCRLPCA